MGVGAFATPQFEQGKKKESIKSMNTLLLHRLLPITYYYILY